MTQGQLAAEVGCKQSALSMFEQGDGTKLNDEVIEKLAKKFNLSLSPSPAKPLNSVDNQTIKQSNNQTILRGFCPNPHCPTNKEYFVEEIRLFLPDREAADPVGGKYCTMPELRSSRPCRSDMLSLRPAVCCRSRVRL